jgi:hypothetical protein
MPDIHSFEYEDVQNKLHIKSIRVLCAKIEDTVLSSGISYHVVHWESADVSEEHVASIFRNQHETELWLLPASRWLLAWLTLRLWRWRWHITLKCQSTFRGIHGVISQRMGLFITIAPRTSNPTKSKTFYCVACSQTTDTELDQTLVRKLQNVKIKSPAHSSMFQK